MTGRRIWYTLACGHRGEWAEKPGAPKANLPRVGKGMLCPDCDRGQLITAVEPGRIDVRTIRFATDSPLVDVAAALADEDVATIFFDTRAGSWGYVFHGVIFGNDYISDSIIGFVSLEDAERSARATYHPQ